MARCISASLRLSITLSAALRGSIVAVALLTAFLTAISTSAFAQGTISGHVSSSDSPFATGMPDTVIQSYDLTNDDYGPSTTTNGNGDYTLNVPAGSYAVFTQNTHGYINKLWNNLPCSATVCDVENLTPIVVTTGATIGINFELDPGTRVSGTVTSSATGLPIAGVRVNFFDPNGQVVFMSGLTDALGHYTTDGGTGTGNVFALTSNTQGYRNEAYDNVTCGDCDDLTDIGTPIAVVQGVPKTGVDFALDPGGRISGTVTDGSQPMANVEVVIADSTGDWVNQVNTDVSGNYTTDGLPAGTYYAFTRNEAGRVDKIYNNITCVNGGCDVTTTGTPITVTVSNTTTGINFALPAGGTITGTVRAAVGNVPIQGAWVGIFTSAGNYIGGAGTDGAGVYTAVAPPGSYKLAVINETDFVGQLYNGLPCAKGNCTIQQNGTLVPVTLNSTTSNIDFSLAQAGSISGTVTDATPSPVNNIQVQVYSSTGTFIASTPTNSLGVYTMTGLAAGSYYVKTGGGSATNLINQLYNGITCVNCSVNSSGGTSVAVTAGATTGNINFSVATGGRISGSVRNAANNALIPNTGVQVYNSSGTLIASYTLASGTYTSQGLPPGTYYVRTTNSLGFINQLFNGIPCPQSSCTPTNGTGITVSAGAVTSAIDFNLVAGAKISGQVTNAAGGAGIQNVNVQVFNSANSNLGSATTDASGNFTTSGLPAASYYLRTSNSLGFVDEVYDNLPCPPNCTATAGTGIVLTGTATVTGKSFSLVLGGGFSGTVTNAATNAGLASIPVQVFSSTGVFIKQVTTDSNGGYTVSGLPAASYFARTNVGLGQFFIDELYSEISCAAGCTNTGGTPIVVTTGTVTGVNFTLTAGGGQITGTVTDAVTNAPLNINVSVYVSANPNPLFVKAVTPNSGTGAYTIGSLPAGTYYARTSTNSSQTYADELFNNLPCPLKTCLLASGAPITVTDNTTTNNINFTLAPNLVQNGDFGNGTTGWKTFGAPDASYMTSNTTGGSFNLRRAVQPAGTAVSQALLFQDTGLTVPANVPVMAQFELANSASKVMIMRVLLLADSSNFGLDFAACTFALPADNQKRTYRMFAHSTVSWPNAAIYFYATQLDPNGGDYYYKVDNVSMQRAPGVSIERTECVDPLAPGAPGGANSANLLTNGDFSSGALTPWGESGLITRRNPMVGGVYEFLRTGVFPPPVVLQQTNPTQAAPGQIPAGQRLTLTLKLGNSGAARKRALVLVNDNDFSSFVACAWWLAPNQALTPYAMQLYTTETWQNPSVSIYPSSGATDQWLRLDDVVLKKTPGANTSGPVCLEGTEAAAVATALGAAPPAGPPAGFGGAFEGPPIGDLVDPPDAGSDAPAGASTPGPAGLPLDDDRLVSPDGTWTKTDDGWTAIATETASRVLQWTTPLDLTHATDARLTFESQLTTVDSRAAVQVSTDGGVTWITVRDVAPADTWQPVAIDLAAFLGEVIDVRFVLDGVAPAGTATPDQWRVREIEIAQPSIGASWKISSPQALARDRWRLRVFFAPRMAPGVRSPS